MDKLRLEIKAMDEVSSFTIVMLVCETC